MPVEFARGSAGSSTPYTVQLRFRHRRCSGAHYTDVVHDLREFASLEWDRFRMTRRSALALLASSALSGKDADAASYKTPYKLNKLVLAASGVNGDFDSKAVDCPFVFRHKGRFYMTY